MSNSCYGCKYLYSDGTGYSDWTWMETNLCCALDKNNALPVEMPFDFDSDKIKTIRWAAILIPCEQYAQGIHITVTPDGNLPNWSNDGDQMRAIIRHQGGNDGQLDNCEKARNIYGHYV